MYRLSLTHSGRRSGQRRRSQRWTGWASLWRTCHSQPGMIHNNFSSFIFTSLFIYLHACLFIIIVVTALFVHLSVYRWYICTCPSYETVNFHLSYLSVYISMSICLPRCLYICISVYQTTNYYLSVFLSAYIYHPYVYLSICLSKSFYLSPNLSNS